MKIKQTTKTILVAVALIGGLIAIGTPATTFADATSTSTTNSAKTDSTNGNGAAADSSSKKTDSQYTGGDASKTNNGCETNTAIIKCTGVTGKNVEGTGLWSILLLAINILTAGVGVAAVGGIVYGAILYTSAGGSEEQVKKAMGVIQNVVIGVVAYALMYGALNFLIPGGLFN